MSTTASTARRVRLALPSLEDRRNLIWITVAYVIGLIAISAFIRTRAISGPFWIDEGLSVGIASHPFSEIFHALTEDGSPPLYYLLLHFWMEAFGRSEENTHVLSLLFALLTIPAALWAGWALFGRRAGYIAAALAAFNPFLVAYAQETRMYSFLALLCLLATACFALAFVRRQRVYLIPLAVLLAAIAYTHNWGLFFDAGCALAVILVWRWAPDRSGIIRDAVLCFGAAAILFLPWVPTLISQAQHTGAPWATRPKPKAWLQVPGNLFGGDLTSFVLLVGAALGLVALWQRRREPVGRTLVTVFVVALAAVLLAWIASQISPAWSTRYQGVVLGPLLLFAAAGLAYSRWLGIGVLLYLVVWWATVTPTPALQNKSDVDDVAAQLGPMLRPGDQVVSTQPEQIPVLYYYLPNARVPALRRHHGPGGRPAGDGLARRAGPAEGLARGQRVRAGARSDAGGAAPAAGLAHHREPAQLAGAVDRARPAPRGPVRRCAAGRSALPLHRPRAAVLPLLVHRGRARGAVPEGLRVASPVPRNLELKAVDHDPEATLAAALALGAEEEATLHQRDTYFFAVTGRLKLREAPPEPAQLIGYARPDRSGASVSAYEIAPVFDPATLGAVLAQTLGVRTVVEKRRRLLLWRGVRIHLDRVAGLGDFVEIEAIASSPGGPAAEEPKVAELRRALGIGDERLVAVGYADLLPQR